MKFTVLCDVGGFGVPGAVVEQWKARLPTSLRGLSNLLSGLFALRTAAERFMRAARAALAYRPSCNKKTAPAPPLVLPRARLGVSRCCRLLRPEAEVPPLHSNQTAPALSLDLHSALACRRRILPPEASVPTPRNKETAPAPPLVLSQAALVYKKNSGFHAPAHSQISYNAVRRSRPHAQDIFPPSSDAPTRTNCGFGLGLVARLESIPGAYTGSDHTFQSRAAIRAGPDPLAPFRDLEASRKVVIMHSFFLYL
ncbi:hypothetical protein MKEN_00615700 [Mycena kentingensis (nom. inval.)]|nr:hypothetical protein MKEN_00615700 [Mycena kentingensis (nom. inval.)]